MTNDVLKPCDLPCPKCGAMDILREFRASRSRWDTHKAHGYSSKYASTDTCGYYMTACRDHIEHHCRTCQYYWQTLPLRKVKRAAAALNPVATLAPDEAPGT